MEDVTSISLPAISPLPEGSRLNDIQKLIEERLSASGVFRGISFSKQIIKISIQTKDLVCFLDSLLTVLSLLEAKQVFAGMDTASILEHTLTKLVRVPPNPFLPFENEINNLAGQTIETDTRFAPKYWVMIALVEAFLQEDIDGLDTTQLTSTLKKLQGACSTFPSNKNSEDLMLFKINQLLSRLVRSDKSNEPQQNNQAEQLSPAIEGPKQFQPPGREEIQENNVPRPNLREVQNDMCELKDKEAERDIKNHLGIGGQGRLDRNQGHNSQPFPERMQMNPNVAYLEKKDRNYTDQDFPSINECYPSAGTTPLQYQAHAGNGYAADAHHQQGSHHGWNNGPRIPLSTQAALDSVIDGIITNRSYSFERSKDYRTTIQHILNERPVSIVEVFADLSIIEIWKLCFSCDTNKLEKCISYDNGDKPVECDPLKELYTTHGYYTLNQARGSFFDLILKLYKVKIFKTNKDLEQTMLSTKAALINLKLLWGMHALNNGKDYLRRQGVKLFSQLVMDLESEDLIELGHQCLEEKDDVFYEIRLYALYRKLQLDNNLVDDFSPLYETKYDAEFNYEKFFKSICEDLFRHIGDTEEKVIRESDLTGLIIAVSRKLENKELDLKFLALIRNLWKKCINEEDVDQRRIGFMKGDNIPSEIKRGIFADILETISISTKSKRSESSLAKMFEGIIAWFSKTTEGNKQYSNEIYQVLEKHWLSDFNQILVEIMENNFHQDGKYIHFIYFLQASEDKKAKDLMTKFKEMCLKTINSFKQSDLSLDLLEKFNVNPKNAVLMMRYLKELLDKKKFPNKSERNALKNSENYLEDESSLEKMLRSHSRLNEVVEFTKKILNDNRIFPLLDRRDPKTIQTDLTTNKSTTPLKRLEHWISYKDTHPFMVKTVNITSNELFCNFFGSLSNGEKEMKANLFEQRLQKAWQLFEEHLKKAVKEIDIRSVDGLKQTVEEIQSGKYENCCDLFYDLTSIELKMIVQNYQILDLMANNDLLNAVFITMGSLRKIGRVAETHTTLKFLESLQGHMPRYIEKKEFIRDQSMNIAIDEIKLLDFITRHQELVIELSKWWPLIEHFKNKNFRHYEELLIYRDTTKYESISNETIARLRQVIDTFNSKKEFSSLLEFLETMLQNEADIRNISHSQGTFTSLIECSEEMAQEETGLSKIESILNDSRIMFLLNDKQYSILAGLNRKEDERFNQTEAYLREGSDRGKQSFSFDLMQDYKIRLSFATEDTNLESKRKHYTSLMINLEAIREALNKIKSRGYIKDLKSSFQEKLYKLASESKDKDHIDYTSQSIHIKSGNVMIKVKAKNREFRTENIEFIRVIFKELVSELENDEFESKPENHWVSNLEGNQLEFLTGYLNAKEKEVYSGEQLGILGEILRQAAERKITRGIDMMEVKRSYVEGLEEEEPRTVKKAIKFLGNEYCSVNSKDIVKTSETQSQKRFKIFGFTGDKWTMFFRLLAEMKHEGKNCNQFYFASQHLDEIELKGFVKRALTDTRQKNYFLIDIHLLSTEMKNELMQYCKDRRAQAKNKNLCLFCKQESVNNIYNEFASNSEVFELLHVPTGDKHSKKLPQSYISKIDCLKVTSEMSGLGKTYYIQQSSKHHRLKTLFLSGEVHPESIEKRIGVLDRHDKMQDTKRPTNLHIKLDMMDNMILNCELLDQILFRICYLKMYPYQGGWYSFEDVEMFYLEIGNSYKHELAKHVSFLNVVELSKNIEHLSAKNWQQLDLKRLQGEEDKVRKILNCWEALKDKRVQTVPLMELMADTEEQEMEDDNNLRKGLMEIFLTKDKDHQRTLKEGNLNQVYGLVNILYNQLSEMEKVWSLDISTWEQDSLEANYPEFLRSLKHTRLVSVRLIFELANELVWSAVSEVRRESMTAMTASKPGDIDLSEYQRLIEAIPKWDKVKRLNIIFAGESMKMVYKHRSDVDREIQDFVHRAVGKEMWDYAALKPKDLELCLLGDLFEAMDLMKVLDKYCDPPAIPPPMPEMPEIPQQKINRIIYSRGSSPNRDEVDPLQEYRVREPPKSDNQKLQEVMKKKAKFNGKGYTITVDNLLKIINIVQRAHHNIPIVIMGATGCGKTYMIDFIANFLFQESFICLTLHSGVSEGDIEELLITAINKAREASSKKRVWLLFDEFNTCPFQCLISEIMTERRCTFSNRIREIPENLVLIAACNPYRIKVSNSRVGLSHESTDIALSHRVYPIPQSLIDYIWDFGRLSDEVETEYIRSMITNDKEFPLEPEAQTQIAKCIITSQKYLRESETDSSVSLRDVQRFLDLYRYFRILESSVDQLIMSVYLCYILRIEDKQGQAALTTRLREELGTTCTVDWSQRIEKLLKEFEEEVSSLVEIPAHVSLNRPLVENLLAIVVSIVNSMPAIICGKPGTSKTLSIGLANDLFNLPAHRKQSIPNRYFRDTRTCIQLQFWGSTSTTSAGISDIFAKARKVKATEENYVCIVFDEIGLAEIADSNPLKVLHSLLESTERNISFIGLSNWKLDLSKMNRVIYVARPDMDAEDLFNTCRLSKGDALLTPYLKGLSKAYHDFRKLEVHEKNSHPNFHGSRDFYQMIRLIKTHVPQITEEPKSEKIGLLIESSIMRNFSGKGKESSDRLLSEYRKQMKPKCPTNIERMSSIDLIFQNMIDNESRHLMVFCETQDIEELIVGEIRRFEANVKGKDPVKFVQLRNTRGSEDLHHLFVNMQMYIKQGYTVVMKDLDIIYGCLYDLLNQNYTVYENRKSCNLFFDNTKHKVTVDPEFKCIILVEDECKLSKKLGIEKRQQPPFLNRFEKHRVTYDDLIQNKAELASIRKMEYQLLNMDKRDLKKEFYPPCKMLHNLSKELVYSRGLNPQAWTKRMSNSNRRATIKEYYAELLNKGAIEGDEQIEEGPLENELAQLRLDSLQSRNFILNRLITREMKDKEREEFKKLFIESHRYNALEDLVEACVTADIGKRYIVFSYSPSWLVKDLVSSMVAGREVQLLTCAEINAKGIVERDNIFRRLLSAPEKVVMIQFMSKSDWKYIQDFRYKLDSLWGSSLQPKTVVLVAHTTAEDVANKLLVPTSINLITENWEMVVIDNLKGCGYDKFFKLLDSSFDDIRTQKSLLQEILPNIILEALNRLISNDTNNYEGLVSVREQVRYITGSKELLEWLTNEVKDKASKEKTTILQYIKKDIAKNKLLAERHLDALDFVMETIQNFFVPAVRKVLEGIEKKAGFGVLVLAGFISADFQKNVFDEWLEFVKCPDLESNPFNQFMFAHQSKKIDFKKFDKRLKEKIMKASDLVKQANRALCQPEVESISFNGEEVELKQVKEKVEGEVWGLVKMKVLEGTEDLVNDYQRVEEKVLFALQVCEIYLTDKGVSFVDQTLRILSVMIQTTFSRQSKYRTEVENSLHNMITLALVLWNLHRKEIEFLVRNTEDKKTVELIRATSALKFYKTYSILSCRDLMGKLFPEQDVTEQGSVQEEIGHYQYFLRNIDVYAMEAGTIRGLKLMVGFLQAWPGEWCEELALEYNKLRRGGTTREEAVQNMILEIIQLAVNKASIESIKSFLDSNLFEILEVLSSSSTDINRRKEVLLSLFKLTFNEVEHSEPTHVTILTRFLFNQHINNDNLNPLRDCLAILQEQCSRRKKPLPRRILWFYSQLVELTSESCAPTILPETLLQDLRSDLELLPGLLSEQKGLSLLAMEEIEIVGRFKARLSRLRTVQATEVANFAPMADRMVREVAGQQGKGHILLILLRGLYCRWPSSEEMRNAGLNYTADLVVSFDAVRSDRFVVVKDGPFSAMKAVFELVQAEPERFSRLESLDYFEKLELLNIAFFGENGCQGDEYSLIVQHRLMNNLCGKFIKEEHVREVVSKREEERDLERAFFVIGHGVNLLESNGVMAQLLRSESALLPCPNDTLQTWLRIRNLYDTRANDQAFKAVWICVQCNCPVILDHCGELAHNDADPSRASKCIGCGIDIGRGHTNLRKIETANWQQQVEEMLREATVRVIYEDLEEEDKSWRREMYPAEVTSEEAATVVHLMDYIIKYARYLRSPYDILGCEDVSTYLFSHILSDIRLLANTIGKDNETITTWLNLLLVDLNGDLEPPVDEMAEARQVDIDICRRTRKSINRLVNKHLKELEDKLSGYGDEKNAKLQRERSLKETQRDYVRGEISNGELLKNYGQRVMEVTTYLRERPQITRQLVIEGLMAKDSLASQFLVRVLKESDLWTSYGTIMQSLKRFSAMISSQYKSCFTPEQCCSSLTLNDLLDGNYPSGEPNEDLRQEFGLLVEILETRLYPLIHRYPDYFEGGFECSMQAQLKKYWLALDRPDNLLAFYVVPINSTSAPAVEEVVMGSLLKCLANIQNKFLQEYSRLSINYSQSDNNVARRIFSKCTEDCFVSIPSEASQRVLDNVFLDVENGERGVSVCIDEQYFAGLVADQAFTNNVQEILVEPMFSLLVAEWSEFKQLIHRVEQVTRARNREDPHKGQEAARVKTCTRNPKLNRLMSLSAQKVWDLQKVLLIVLRRVLEEDISEYEWLEKVVGVKDAKEWREHVELLRDCQILDLGDIRRVLLVALYAAVSLQGPRTMYVEEREGAEKHEKAAVMIADYVVEELKVLYTERVDQHTRKLSREKESRMLEHLSDLLEEEDYKLVGDIMHQLNHNVPEGSDSGKKLTVKEFPGVIKAIEEKYALK